MQICGGLVITLINCCTSGETKIQIKSMFFMQLLKQCELVNMKILASFEQIRATELIMDLVRMHATAAAAASKKSTVPLSPAGGPPTWAWYSLRGVVYCPCGIV